MNELKEIRDRVLVNVKEVVEENKEKIEEAYQWIMRLEYTARKEGLLALEYEAGFIPKDMMLCDEIGKMVYMVTCGTEPKFLSEIMVLKFLANDYQGIEALLYFLYARSILLLQAGESPMQAEELFNAVIPKNVLFFDKRHSIWEDDKKRIVKEVKGAMSEEEKKRLEDISKQLQSLSEEEWKSIVSSKTFYGFDKVVPYLDEKTQGLVKEHINECRYETIMTFVEALKEQELYQIADDFKEMISVLRETPESKGLMDDIVKYSDTEIQYLMRHVEYTMLALALKGERGEIAECFYRNLSLRLKYEVQDAMAYMGPVRRCDVEEAQRKIMKIAKDRLGW